METDRDTKMGYNGCNGVKQTNLSEEEGLIQTEQKWLASFSLFVFGYHAVASVAATCSCLPLTRGQLLWLVR